MSTESFLKLKEFDSLCKAKSGQLKAIKEQDDRLSVLNQRRQEHQSLTEKLKQETFSLHQLYFEQEKKLKSAEEQASRLRDIGGDEAKIKNYLEEARGLEDGLFELLEKTEATQLELKENGEFLSGLEKTIQEIELEVKSEVSRVQEELGNTDLRLKLIEEELPANFQQLLKKTLAKNLAIGIFTRNDQGSCFFCRYKISKTDESEIDLQYVLKTCPQCQRIFLPYGC